MILPSRFGVSGTPMREALTKRVSLPLIREGVFAYDQTEVQGDWVELEYDLFHGVFYKYTNNKRLADISRQYGGQLSVVLVRYHYNIGRTESVQQYANMLDDYLAGDVGALWQRCSSTTST